MLSVALLSGAIVTHSPGLFVTVFILDLWLLGYHHVIATFTKLAGTKADRKENMFLIYFLPLIVLLAVAALYAVVGMWAVVTIYFFWQWYHYTRQSYGIATFYRKKAGHPVEENKYIALATIWSVPVWGILYRCAQGWDEFLFLPMRVPPVPMWVPFIAGIISLALIMNWAVSLFRAWNKGSVPIGHTLYMLSHFTTFGISYVVIKDINTGWLVANIWHNAQYILFVWLFNQRRFAKPDFEEKNWLWWISQPGPMRMICYFLACLLVTTVFYGGLKFGFDWFAAGDTAIIFALYVVSFQALNFHHYIVDSKIWKARKKQHQVVMDLKGAPNV